MSVQSVVLQDKELIELLVDKFGQNTLTANYFDNLDLKNESVNVFENGEYKSTVVSLGTDARVGTKPSLQTPDLRTAEIKLDGLNNPYITLSFQMSRQMLDGAKVVSFNVYRKKVKPTSLGQTVEPFSKADFDMIGRGSTLSGKFSQERKAQFQLDSSLQPVVAKNANLFDLQQTTNAQGINQSVKTGQQSIQSQVVSNQTQIDADFKKIAEVNYANFTNQQELKQTYVIDNSTVTITYDDTSVSYGSGYVYAVSAFSLSGEESSKSQTISLVLLDLNGIDPPLSLSVKQTTETSVQVSGIVQQKDNIRNIYIFRRDQQSASAYELLAIFPPKNNGFIFLDDELIYAHSYSYRVILDNIFGVISEPKEVVITCTTQKATEKSRSHNLAVPIILATPDPSLTGIKISVLPNDNKILYYSLDRRNISWREKNFSIPGNEHGDFWHSNQLWVVPNSGSQLAPQLTANLNSGSLPPQNTFLQFSAPIEFTDTYISPDNYYQYRITGIDLFGNKTSYAFASLAAIFAGPLRTPKNLSYQVLRQTPFRIKLNWNDDNAVALAEENQNTEKQLLDLALQATNLNASQVNFIENLLQNTDVTKIDYTTTLAPLNLTTTQITAIQNQISNIYATSNIYKYSLQRRKLGQVSYDQFPLTVNKFIIDEAPSTDFIVFSTGSIEDTFTALTSSSPPVDPGSILRPFGSPSFLENEQIYEYRIAVQSLKGGTSIYSDPISVLCSAVISNPATFTATVLNKNVLPLVIVLNWEIESFKSFPDHWRIERKVINTTDDYRVIGNAYIATQYFDRNLQIGKQYQYRIRSIGITGVESDTYETSVST